MSLWVRAATQTQLVLQPVPGNALLQAAAYLICAKSTGMTLASDTVAAPVCSRLRAYLPHKVREELSKAQWDAKKHVLKVTMPIVRDHS